MISNSKSNILNNGCDNDDEYEPSIASASAPGIEIVVRTDKPTCLTPTADAEAGTGNGYWHQNLFSRGGTDLSNVKDEDTSAQASQKQKVFFDMVPMAGCKKAILGLGSAALLFATVVGIIIGASSRNNRISSSAVATAKAPKAPKAKSSKAPKAGGYYEYLYEDWCRDFANEYFPVIYFSSNSNMALDDPHGYCVEKCGNCVFDEDMVPEGMFRGIVHEKVGPPAYPSNITFCGCHYDALVHDDISVDFACAFNDPEFTDHWSHMIGTGPMRRSLPPVPAEIGAPNNIVVSSEGSRFWSEPVSDMVMVASQEGGGEEDLSCYQWVEFGSTFAPTASPSITTTSPSISAMPSS